jgi:hypothetical protein
MDHDAVSLEHLARLNAVHQNKKAREQREKNNSVRTDLGFFLIFKGGDNYQVVQKHRKGNGNVYSTWIATQDQADAAGIRYQIPNGDGTYRLANVTAEKAEEKAAVEAVRAKRRRAMALPET